MLNFISESLDLNEDLGERDRFKITAYLNKEKVGWVVYEKCQYFQWYFEPEMTEDEYNIIFPEDKFIMLESLFVYQEFRSQGFANELMNKFVSESLENYDYKTLFLNAYPQDSISRMHLTLDNLIKFYERFGFIEIPGHRSNMNCYMIKDF